MAYIYSFTPNPPMSRDVYEETLRRLADAGAANPTGRICHVAYGDESDLRVIDTWESRETFESFGRTLMPILADLGVYAGEPDVEQVSNVIIGPSAGSSRGRNAAAHRALYDAFNRRDLDGAARLLHDDGVMVDHPRGLSVKGPEQMRDWLQEWVDAFSNASTSDVHIIDAGDTTVGLFHGRGTNDGPFGPYAATGRRIDVPFCDVNHWDASGRILRGETFYDLQTFMVQLGHAEPPTSG